MLLFGKLYAVQKYVVIKHNIILHLFKDRSDFGVQTRTQLELLK